MSSQKLKALSGYGGVATGRLTGKEDISLERILVIASSLGIISINTMSDKAIVENKSL